MVLSGACRGVLVHGPVLMLWMPQNDLVMGKGGMYVPSGRPDLLTHSTMLAGTSVDREQVWAATWPTYTPPLLVPITRSF